jgi:Na+-driven multidrug efflux pump
MITFHLAPLKTILDSWKQVLYIGIPSAATRIIIPIGVGVITRFVSAYGPESVAAFGVASRIEFFAVATVMALASVIGPFVGQNRGAGMMDRVYDSVHYSKRFALVWGGFIFIVLAVLAKPLVALFNDDPTIVSGASVYLRIVPLGYGLYGILVLSASILNVLKKPFHAASLSIFQMFILYIPMALAGSALWGLPGIFIALAASYFIAGTVALAVLKRILATEQKAVANIHIQ